MAKKRKTKPTPPMLEQYVQQADDYIMMLCEPEKMMPLDAITFLDRVISRCDAAIEALREENDL
jgi:hypothetical protein